MRTKFNGILTLFLALIVQMSFAQEKTISGTVSDETGPLPGVTILKKGTTQGTETDFDGNYSIQAKTGDILVFSFVGMKTVERTIGSSSTLNVTMQNDVNILEEVVVTAIGIKRKPKELTASVAKLKNEDLTKTKSVNATSGIIGKVSGIQINTISNSVNPNTRIVLRGSRSLRGNNQALVVIDGSPAPRSAIDRINPDDIESMTILKGSKSAALYGSAASNGVVVITTKKGRDRMSIQLSSTLELSSVAYLPELQEEFGAGGFPDGNLLPLENVNWGPRYDGRLVDASETLDNGEVWQVPFSPIKDRNKNFFDVGTTIRNGVSISGGDQKSDYLFSLDQTNVNGIVPKDKYNRTNVRFKASRKYNKLTVGGNLSFFRSHANVVGEGGRQGRPVYWNVLNTPLHLPLDQMKNWRTGKFTRNEVSYFRFYENPYFIIDTQREKTDINQFNFIADINYEINDWISATVRPNYTYTSNKFDRRFGAFTYEFHLQNVYSEMDEYGAVKADQLTTTSRFNNDFLLTFDKNITEDFSAKLILGNNIFLNRLDRINVEGTNLIVPDFFHVSTRTGELTGNQFSTENRRVSVYGDLTLGYKDFLFLNATARNDWSSTLPKQNNSFFYPSFGLSFVASDAIPSLVSPKGLSYLKLNASWAKTGNDADPLVANDIFFAPDNFPYGSTAGLSQTSNVSDPNLKPEFTESIEAGIEFGLINNRITGSINGYKTNTTNQILNVDVPFSSGARTYLTNVGELQNMGLELDLNVTPIKTEDFKWDVSANYSTFDTEVISLMDGADQIQIGSLDATNAVNIVAKVGEQFPLIETTAYLRDPQGRIIVGDDGDPIQDTKNQIQGQVTPDQILGLTTNLKYKNFNLYVAADYRTGHVFYNNLVDALEFTGLTQHSVTNNRQPFVFPNSSYSDGNGGYISNNNRLTSGGGNAFWDSYNEVKENYVTDASAWKIREIALSYNFDKELLKSVGIQDLSLGIYGRNLFTFRPSDNVYTDPEFNSNRASTSNFVGVGTQSQTPPTRQYGLTLNVKF
ncbi:SusC/RagA family TonB-linked outer membrane protein [Tenacibaculum sp. IMCC1]|uniref:SusC/RagA family TonB-linked outer membrane protein n=1 Tax=Tenacibaculum sp. Pbs-1 TaxID=3238748 RepID=A0AB33KXC2_9FLAO